MAIRIARTAISLTVHRVAVGLIAVAALSVVACRHVATLTPVLGIYPDPILRQGTVVDQERAALRVGALRVCVREERHNPPADTLASRKFRDLSLIDSVPISLRLSRRGNRRVLFGTEVLGRAAGKPACSLLDAVAGTYDLWVARDGPIPVTLLRSTMSSRPSRSAVAF